MQNKYVPFIDDGTFEDLVRFFLNKAEEGVRRSIESSGRNVIDPFAAMFAMAAFNLTPTEWEQNERYRQAEKSLTNALGDFHQKLLGSING
jgi:hypothetical protein